MARGLTMTVTMERRAAVVTTNNYWETIRMGTDGVNLCPTCAKEV